MKLIFTVILLVALTSVGHAYNLKYSYSGKNNSTEYYGTCDNGEQVKVTQYRDGSLSFEGPAGEGRLAADNATLDTAAAAACGE